MDVVLSRDLRILQTYSWEDEEQVSQIAKAVRAHIVNLEERLERLDKVENILNKLEADGKTDVLEHFKDLKT